jgi:hypothetical protein
VIPYWILWSYFFVGTLGSQRQSQHGTALSPGLLAGLLLVLLMVGLRYQVGGDWYTYQRMFEWSGRVSFDRVMARGDVGYGLTNLLALKIGTEIWLVNLICSGLFTFGLARLAGQQQEPWACLLIAIPYLVVVVAMGYTRQSAAIGCIMAGFASLLQRRSLFRFALWILVGALFHKTAVIAFPLIAFVLPRNKILNTLLIASASVALYFAFVEEAADDLVRNYISARYSSTGALIRVSMCVVPAFVFFLCWRKLAFGEVANRLWRNLSLAAFGAALLLAISPSSTAVDRIALYLLPLQLVVLGRLPGTVLERTTGQVAVALYSGAVLFTWLNFGVFSRVWIPYGFWPFS